MYLTNRFSSSFHHGVRSRGQAYFNRGLVNIVEGSKEVVRAVVRGGSAYDVALKIEGRELLVACTCPYYDKDLCKHVWATLVAAQRKGYLTGTDRPPSRLVMSDTEDFEEEPVEYDEDGDDEDDYDTDYDDKTPAIARRLNAKPLPRRLEQPAPKTAWQQQLESLNQSMTSLTDEQTRPWPSTRELFYIVDVRSTMSGNGLAISLACREIKQNGQWGKLRTTGLPTIRVAQLPEPDRQIVALLL